MVTLVIQDFKQQIANAKLIIYYQYISHTASPPSSLDPVCFAFFVACAACLCVGFRPPLSRDYAPTRQEGR